MRKLLLAVFLLLGISVVTYAQNKKTAIVKGKLVNSATKEPYTDIKVTMPDLNVFTNSDGDGNFELSEVPYGSQKIIISSTTIRNDTVMVTIDKDVVDIPAITLTPNDKGTSAESIEIPVVASEENNISTDDDASASSSVQSAGGSGLVSASRDPFVYTTAYILGAYYFRPRGYDRNQQEVQVNGIPINDLETNYASWSQLGGQNDVFRARNTTYGLDPSPYTFGGLTGSSYIAATAADQRKEIRATYTSSDRNYKNRIMLTANSGLMKNGWAYSVSVSKRWAQEGYVPGTFYDGYAYYAGVSKVYKRGQINFTTFGAPTKRGKSGTATDEMFDLAGTHYYNPDWGYQNGKIRNAKVANTFQPTSILNYTYKVSHNTTWNTSFGYEFGKNKSSTIDYFNGASPFPDYYRNFPSYYELIGDTSAAKKLTTAYRNNPQLMQIDWSRLYNANYNNVETIANVNGVAGNSFTGRRSVYVMSDYVDDLRKFTFNTNLNHKINEHINVSGGLTYVGQRDENYRQLTDLLGGTYYVNYNQFATQQAVGNVNYYQNNLNAPNQIIRVGDKYGYDYAMRLNDGLAWAQSVFTYDKVDFFIAANAGITSFSRDGFMRNGLFPDNSYGVSATQNFFKYAVKGGITYKIDSRNFLYVNASYSATPPTADNTFISAETRDFTVSNPTVQHNKSVEGGYMIKSPLLTARISGYVTDITDATQILRFYNDDPGIQTFTNYVMQNVNTRNIGTELAVDVKVTKQLTVTGVASVGQAFYTNRPTVSIYQDNDPTLTASTQTLYIKNYYLGVGPQSAYSLGLNYRSNKYWYATVNFNYLDRNYVDINPNRRTTDAADLVPLNSPMWNSIYGQEELPSIFTVDIRAGKSFQLAKIYDKTLHRVILYVNVGVNNLLNNTNNKSIGYEQLRYDYQDRSPYEFANKYAYGLGINYYANISIKF